MLLISDYLVTFKIFDMDRDGLLSVEEIRTMIKIMINLKSENIPHSSTVIFSN